MIGENFHVMKLRVKIHAVKLGVKNNIQGVSKRKIVDFRGLPSQPTKTPLQQLPRNQFWWTKGPNVILLYASLTAWDSVSDTEDDYMDATLQSGYFLSNINLCLKYHVMCKAVCHSCALFLSQTVLGYNYFFYYIVINCT